MPATDPQPSPSKRPGLIRRTFRRHWIGLIALWLLGSLASVALIYQSVKPSYKASNLLRGDPPKADLFDSTKAGGESMDAFLTTQLQLLTSPNVLTAAGTSSNAAKLERIQKAGDVVQELRKALNVIVVPGTYLIEVSVTSPNASEAATIVNAVVDAFLEANAEWSDGMKRVQIKNLEMYSLELKNQTDELERKWKDLAARGELDLKARQSNLISADHGAKIEQRLVENDLDRLQAQAQLEAYLARPVKDQARIEELETRIDAANRLEKALNQRRASAGFDPRNVTEKTHAHELAFLQDDRNTIRGMQEAVLRRLEQLRYETKAEARIRPVNFNGAQVPSRPISDRRPLLLAFVPFATFALVVSLFVGVEAWTGARAGAKVEPEGEV